MRLDKREALRSMGKLAVVGSWSVPIINQVILPAHAQTSVITKNIEGKWRFSRSDGSVIDSAYVDRAVLDIELLPNGDYQISPEISYLTAKERINLWEVREDGRFYFVVDTASFGLVGEIVYGDSGNAIEILTTNTSEPPVVGVRYEF